MDACIDGKRCALAYTHTRTHAHTMELNEAQAAAFQAVKSGRNLFLTGPAGSGKSFLLQTILRWGAVTGKHIAVTALTGCAALLLGFSAKTLHSWAGIGLGRDTADKLAEAVKRSPSSKARWRKTSILIIDEISMMTPELFEKLDCIGKHVRASAAPWGGLQLVLCGDFLQLPPVVRGLSGETAIGRFAFESPAWKAAQLEPHVLTKIERQTDAAFQTLLNECRIGAPSTASIAVLQSRQHLDWKSRTIRPTLLFSRNADVDSINEKNIAALQKPLRMFDVRTALDRSDPTLEVPTGERLERVVEKLDSDAPYMPHLELCVGAQVMLLFNKDIEVGLVNGSRGVVLDFRPSDGVPIVQFLHGDPIAVEPHGWASADFPAVVRMQIPLRVAYAVTIHKSQGATLDCALVDIGSTTFEYGQAYVALSRVRNLESLYIWNLDPARIRAHPTVLRFYETLAAAAPPAAAAPVASTICVAGSPSWDAVLRDWTASAAGAATLARVAERRAAGVPVYPSDADVFAALRETPLQSVRVVLLGQDPYHGAGQAHGLSFSVQAGVTLPPSLKNIRKEFLSDLGLPDSAWPPSSGDLTPWARRGVLLLNATLTVEDGSPNSHAEYGWHACTALLLDALVTARYEEPLVFLAWGRYAQTVIARLKLGPRHCVLAAAHPSPLSAAHGFFGSRPFSRANAHLAAAGAAPIDWSLAPAPAVALQAFAYGGAGGGAAKTEEDPSTP
jgi:uracil-DNA glycosylase